MKKVFFSALLALACSAMMTACNNNPAHETTEDSTAVEAPVIDTVKYFGNGLTEGSQAEYIIAGDQVTIVEGDQTYEGLNTEVFYGETMPEELNNLEEGAVVLQGSVVDRMNHGEKNNCWIKVIR